VPLICVVFTQVCDSTIFDVSFTYIWMLQISPFHQCYILGVLGHHLFSVSLLKFVLAVSHTFAFGHEADAKISTKYFNLKIFRGLVGFLMADTAIDRMIGYQSSRSLISVHRLLSLEFDDWSMTNGHLLICFFKVS